MTDGERDWTLAGTAHVSGLPGLPDIVLDLHETEKYAVFAYGERLQLVPIEEVDP